MPLYKHIPSEYPVGTDPPSQSANESFLGKTDIPSLYLLGALLFSEPFYLDTGPES